MSYYMEVSSCPTLPLSWVSKCPVSKCPVSICPGFAHTVAANKFSYFNYNLFHQLLSLIHLLFYKTKYQFRSDFEISIQNFYYNYAFHMFA